MNVANYFRRIALSRPLGSDWERHVSTTRRTLCANSGSDRTHNSQPTPSISPKIPHLIRRNYVTHNVGRGSAVSVHTSYSAGARFKFQPGHWLSSFPQSLQTNVRNVTFNHDTTASFHIPSYLSFAGHPTIRRYTR